jgi:hypothetical protein
VASSTRMRSAVSSPPKRPPPQNHRESTPPQWGRDHPPSGQPGKNQGRCSSRGGGTVATGGRFTTTRRDGSLDGLSGAGRGLLTLDTPTGNPGGDRHEARNELVWFVNEPVL